MYGLTVLWNDMVATRRLSAGGLQPIYGDDRSDYIYVAVSNITNHLGELEGIGTYRGDSDVK